mmetsp:Transcript_1596/g.6584  ORF Transcript_1596/g.6584 Transcript_1596/m.6584 type:complete len:331 (+) Transcript_1596:632-1624(+)
MRRRGETTRGSRRCGTRRNGRSGRRRRRGRRRSARGSERRAGPRRRNDGGDDELSRALLSSLLNSLARSLAGPGEPAAPIEYTRSGRRHDRSKSKIQELEAVTSAHASAGLVISADASQRQKRLSAKRQNAKSHGRDVSQRTLRAKVGGIVPEVSRRRVPEPAPHRGPHALAHDVPGARRGVHERERVRRRSRGDGPTVCRNLGIELPGHPAAVPHEHHQARLVLRLDGAEVADVPEPREYLGRRPVQPRVRQRHETPRALLRAHRTAHAHVPVGQHAVVRRRVVNLGHHVFELRVGWPVEDDAGAPLGVVVEDEDDGVAPPALFGFGRE